MNKDDYKIATSQSSANTITHDDWLKINKKLEHLSVNKEDLELLHKAITGESLREFDSLNRSTSEGLLELYNEDGKAFELKIILPIIDKDAEDKDGNTSLHLASKAGLSDIVKIILNKGTDPNIVNYNESTPVHLAAQRGHGKVIETLFNNKNNPYKAELNVEDNFGKIPLHYAAEGGYTDAVRVLTEYDPSTINVRTKDQECLTALEIAEKNKHLETTLVLLPILGIEMRDIPATSDISESRKHPGLTNALAQTSAYVNTPNNQEDLTILSFKQNEGGTNLEKALLNEKSDDITKLHLAAEQGDIATLKTLIGKGVDLNIPDRAGNTALYNATVALHKASQNLSVKGINIDGQGRVVEPFITEAITSEVVKELITNGAKLDEKSIEYMVSNGYHGIILPSSLNYAKQNSNLQTTYFRLSRPRSELSKVQYKSDPRKQRIVQNIITSLTKEQETVKAHILQDLAKQAGIPQAIKRHINPTVVEASPASFKKPKISKDR